MNRESQRKLKFDVRLQQRPGWLSEEEKEAELASLQDSVANVESGNEEPENQPNEPETSHLAVSDTFPRN